MQIFKFWRRKGLNVKIRHRDPQKALFARKRVVWRIDRENRPTVATCRRGEVTKKTKQSLNNDILRMRRDPHAARSLPYLEAGVASRTHLRTPSFMVIGSVVLLLGVAENPTFPILSALAYTTGLGYGPTWHAAYYKNTDALSTITMTIDSGKWRMLENTK